MNNVKKHFLEKLNKINSERNYAIRAEIGETRLTKYISYGNVREGKDPSVLFDNVVEEIIQLAEEFGISLENASWFGKLQCKENNWVYGKEREIR